MPQPPSPEHITPAPEQEPGRFQRAIHAVADRLSFERLRNAGWAAVGLAVVEITVPNVAAVEAQESQEVQPIEGLHIDFFPNCSPDNEMAITGFQSNYSGESEGEIRMLPDEQYSEGEYGAPWQYLAAQGASTYLGGVLFYDRSGTPETTITAMYRRSEGEQPRAIYQETFPPMICNSDGEPEEAPEGIGGGDGRAIDFTEIGGATRLETARQIANDLYPSGRPDSIVIARADAYPDALAGGSLASSGNGPILLTSSGTLSDTTRSELHGILRSEDTVYILGGESAISEEVVEQIQDIADMESRGTAEVVRLAGSTRIETSIAIAEEMDRLREEGLSATSTDESGATVYLASSENFNDALSAGPLAARGGSPILLGYETLGLPEAITAYLEDNADRVDNIVAVGAITLNTAALDEAIAASTAAGGDESTSIELIGDGDPIATSIAAARRDIETQDRHVEEVVIATAEKFPDGLAGTPYVASVLGRVMVQVVGTYNGETASTDHDELEQFIADEKTPALGADRDGDGEPEPGIVYLGLDGAVDPTTRSILSFAFSGPRDNEPFRPTEATPSEEPSPEPSATTTETEEAEEGNFTATTRTEPGYLDRLLARQLRLMSEEAQAQ